MRNAMKLEQFIDRVDRAFYHATHEPLSMDDKDKAVIAKVHSRTPPGTAEQAVSEIIADRAKRPAEPESAANSDTVSHDSASL